MEQVAQRSCGQLPTRQKTNHTKKDHKPQVFLAGLFIWIRVLCGWMNAKGSEKEEGAGSRGERARETSWS